MSADKMPKKGPQKKPIRSTQARNSTGKLRGSNVVSGTQKPGKKR